MRVPAFELGKVAERFDQQLALVLSDLEQPPGDCFIGKDDHDPL